MDGFWENGRFVLRSTIEERVRNRDKENDQLRARIAELERENDNLIAEGIHSCGPSCTRSGCVNRQLREELAKPKRSDFREMREMLRAMQAGELTVSRGIEILGMWEAGNWHNSMLPPVRQDLVEEDSMPVEIIDRLKAELAKCMEDAGRWRVLQEMRSSDTKEGLVIAWYDVHAPQRISGLGGRDPVAIIDAARKGCA